MEVFNNAFITLQGHWLGSFCLNLLGYAIIIIPAGLLIRQLKKSPKVEKDRNYYANLSLEDKRKEYKCGNYYKTLDQIVPWSEWRLRQKFRCEFEHSLPETNEVFNKKVSIWQGDITWLEIDAIVNAANRSLLGGGGVDGAIHNAAGWSLRDECEKLNGCDPGDAKLTSGHCLPAKHILHTVGPINDDKDVLKSCYETCLKLVEENGIRSIAFSCVATGVYGFPNEEAAHIALSTVRSWLESENRDDKIDRIIFCVFLDIDYKIYQKLMQLYFPRQEEVPSIEMLQKRLDSLREIPIPDVSKDQILSKELPENAHLPVGDDHSTCAQDTSKDENGSTQVDTLSQKADKSLPKNGDTPFTGDGDLGDAISPKDEGRSDTEHEHVDNKNTNDAHPEDENEDGMHEKYEHMRPVGTAEDTERSYMLHSNNNQVGGHENEIQDDATSPGQLDVSTQDRQPTVIDSDCMDQPSHDANEGTCNTQPPTLQKSITAPPRLSGTSGEQ